MIVRNGHKESAFALAEKYRDFRSLASLCHKENVYPPQENPNADRIQLYVEKFKGEFTTELFRWYIEHGLLIFNFYPLITNLPAHVGELRLLFAHDDIYSGYMDMFFAENPCPSISWIHDLGKGRHGPASQALLSEAEKDTDLDTKHVNAFPSFQHQTIINYVYFFQLMLSIGKLAHLAQLHETEALADESILDGLSHDYFCTTIQSVLTRDSQRFMTTLISSVYTRPLCRDSRLHWHRFVAESHLIPKSRPLSRHRHLCFRIGKHFSM